MTDVLHEEDLLAGWASRPKEVRRSRRGVEPGPGSLRFAFYGRTSTSGFQDRVSSRQWQFESARDLIAGRGVVVAEFFDVGYSRRLPWAKRPQAAALLATIADPDRGFDAVVVGEYERAFYGDQLLHLAVLFDQHGVQLWLPETNGPVNRRDSSHQALVMLLGAQSRREVLRSRFRVTAAMRNQAREQGRYLGGRPPYGYRLVDAGPHPNAVHALWGRRLRRLEPDPATAPTVAWIFGQRLAGQSVAAIARALNDQGVPCPSIMDPVRNRHRAGDGWSLRTVAAILANPRYTGRQVWNRQRTDHDVPGQDSGQGRGKVLRWNTADQWVISKDVAHPAVVSETDFVAAQHINAVPIPRDGASHRYLLVGLVLCGRCKRRMDAHWVHGRPGYRCRHGATTANPRRVRGAKTLYLREDRILERITVMLGTDPDAGHSPGAAVDYLRDNNLMIVCTTTGCTLDTPYSNP
ncbi:MAG: site-specific recombinase [Micromonosporaceae bacterium]|nr:site-specific recombinase [Micromonosporaceae bacterium]